MTIRLEDPRWEDPALLRAEMARAGLITRSAEHGWRLRTAGWIYMVALAAMAEGDPDREQPGLARALRRIERTVNDAGG